MSRVDDAALAVLLHETSPECRQIRVREDEREHHQRADLDWAIVLNLRLAQEGAEFSSDVILTRALSMRDRGAFTDAEWAAVAAVLFVQSIEMAG